MKNLKRKLFCLAAMAILSCSVWAQSIREYVCVVHGNLSSENKTFLTDLKDSLERNGYTYYSKYIGSFLEGTFGSGFIWYASDGTPYVVTNRHVAGNYETVNLSFENEDGSVSEFKEMKVVFSDDDIDIALISLPSTFKRPGLQFTSAKINDGDDVFSAGFPGLAGKPSWQLGKGVVSNSSARIKELIDPEISSVIQHTAQIDGGNSGGPLLIKDSSSKAGYKVCGVNTWSAAARQNTNFSIPAAAVEKTVKSKIIQKKTVTFDEHSVAFIKACSENDEFTSLMPYISNSMVSSYGEKALKDVLAKAPTDVRSYVSYVFESNPLIGLRCSLAYVVWSKIHSDSERIDLKETSDEATGKKVIFNRGDSTFESFWIEDQGSWRLSDFEGVTKDKKLSNKEKARNQSDSIFSIEEPYFMSVSGGYFRNITESSNSFMFDFKYRFNFVSVGFTVMKDTLTMEKEYNLYPESDKNSIYDLGLVAGLQLPLKIDRVIIMPLVEGQAGMIYKSGSSQYNLAPFFYGIGGGIEFAYCTDFGFSPFLGAKYMANTYFKRTSGYDDNIKYSTGNFAIYAGVKFFER
ncbi:serine protease Do [Treponema bryantii]|uniref:Serine protease Do n=1 Tax=Treponema bryantii TaxID=163 RepID=A0A1H8ZYD4_9SPIR|nr:serine protease [Treponema bryantii]SEP69404.1 serine protease Do [Treponema bryantii]